MNIEKIKSFCKDLLPYVVIVLVVIIIRTFIVTPVRVDGPSMKPNLKNGNIMILNKIANIDRYDIVVIKSLKLNETLIKRVYALPGEKIKCEDGKIYINGSVIKDEYGSGTTADFDEVTVPNDSYFVMGDNRPISLDSRLLGTFTKDEIKGTTSIRIFPLNRFGFVK